MPRLLKSRIFLLTIFTKITLYAQEASMPLIVQPSPTASSLGSYGEYKVSNYTGIPAINIPLYTIKSGDIELPISMSYNASGVKVTHEASWVGLGWSLNAGGVITRQVMKIDDFKDNVGYAMGMGGYTFPQIAWDYTAYGNYYPNAQSTQFPAPTYVYPDTEFILGGGNGRDTEPDIYSYSFLDYSGKLLIKPIENGVIKGITTDQNNLDFVYHKDIKQWEVTDVKGWKYFFGTTELSKASINGCINTPDTEAVETAWYIDKIITPKGDNISFSYTKNNGYVHSFGGVSEDKTFLIGCGANGFFGNADITCNDDNSISKNYNKAIETYLNKINFRNGSVVFNQSNENRLDRTYESTANPPKALGSLSVFDNNNNKINDFLFKTSYFNQSQVSATDKEMYLRLKLDELISFPNSNNPQSYKFQYSDIALPRKDSYSIDHWGYYNGANNTSLQPYEEANGWSDIYGKTYGVHTSLFSTLVPFYYNNVNKFLLIGANRETNSDYIQAGLLNSIFYPTGGKTKFEFEANEYRTTSAYYNINPEIVSTTSVGITEASFNIERKTFVLLDYSFDNAATYESDPFIYNKVLNTNVILEKQDGTKVLKFFPSKKSNSDYFNNTTRTYVSVLLDPGIYKIKSNNGGYIYFNIKLTGKILKDALGQTTKKGGGIRIKSIQNYDGTGNLTKKNFAYLNDDGNSSGKLMSDIFNFYNDTQLWKYFARAYTPGQIWNAENTLMNANINLGDTCYPDIDAGAGRYRYIKAFSSSVVPEGSSAGGQAVGYSQVTVTQNTPFPFSQNTNLGKSVYNYKNTPDTQLGWFFPNLKEYEHNDNGQVISEKHYNSDAKLVSEKINEYSVGYTYSSTGFRIISGNYPRYCRIYETGRGCTPAGDTPYNRFYKKDVTWWYPSKITEKSYPSAGGAPITTTKNYFYDNLTHKQLTKEETIFPDVTMQKTYKYADETGNQLMKDNNMIGIPLVSESQKTENSITKTLQKVETYFPKTTSELSGTKGLILPMWTKTYELNNLTTPNTFITYDQYDAKGNILQYSEKGVKPVSFVWGYNQTLPIAKIEGAKISDIPQTLLTNIINASNTDAQSAPNSDETSFLNALDSFRRDTAMQNYLVSTYTYDPLLGLRSVTYPSGIRENYIYDSSNRLKQILDVDGKILKEYSYNYSNKMANDVSLANISGLNDINLFVSIPTATVQYTFSTKNMPNDLHYYWSIAPIPSSGATSSGASIMYNDSPTVNATFKAGGKYILNLYVVRSSTGESYTISKTINVNFLIPSSTGNTFSSVSPIVVQTSAIYLNGSSVSGYLVFTPYVFSGTVDIALIPSDKAPSVDRSISYQQTTSSINRIWTFIFKTTGLVSASYTGTPLTLGETINLPSFTYQK